MTFASLGLSETLLRAIAKLAHTAPTPVQAAAIPAILRGDDVRASAQTGSGKTAAFVLPMLHLLAARPARARGAVRALILAPTRELAVQIAGAIDTYGAEGSGLSLRTCLAIGGHASGPQLGALRGGAQIVVATPGRLLDLVKKAALDLSAVELVVLDEADRLLALGFAAELDRVFALLPSRRQTLLFSATMPTKVLALADKLLVEPTKINVDAGGIPEFILQRAIEVDESARPRLLLRLLETHAWPQLLVFVASRAGAEALVTRLGKAGVRAASLHGELSQGARAHALEAFKAARVQVLVATDLAARGLDIGELPAVVNFDLPRSPVDYLHRIGRTGRAGAAGDAISFISAGNAAHFRLIEKRHRLRVTRERLAGLEPRELGAPARDPHGGIKGKRKSKKDKLREAALLKPGG